MNFMRKNQSSFFIFLSKLLVAKITETIFLQRENKQLLRLKSYEVTTENYIVQNIAIYNLPSDLPVFASQNVIAESYSLPQ